MLTGRSSFSADGTKLTFTSDASNLVPNDTNNSSDVFVKNLTTGTLERVSIGAGLQGDGSSSGASLSADGTRVVFSSTASNLVAGDANGVSDVFVKNLATGAIGLVTSGTYGQGNNASTSASISADGTRIAFGSDASNLVAGDTNASADVFVKNVPSIKPTSVVFLASSRFGTNPSAGGWVNNDYYPRKLGDVNGDGRADIVGFGYSGVATALGTSIGVFDTPRFVLANFSTSPYNWSSDDLVPRDVGDVNGDGRADIVGFARSGVYTALGLSDGTFTEPRYVMANFGAEAGGWSSSDLYPRKLGDVNGDGRADIVGFAQDGVYTALGKADGAFEEPRYVLRNFSPNPYNWNSDNIVPRELGDVNGDGRDDIVGFSRLGTYVALGLGDGSFGQNPFLATKEFGTDAGAGGWTSDNAFPRELGDVNGDGRADIIGFGQSGVYVALGRLDGYFDPGQFALNDFGTNPEAGGWSSESLYPREVGDVNGDGRADIVGFKQDGVYVALGNASGTFF